MKPVIWIGSSLEDLREFPSPVQDRIGYPLFVAQCGSKHRDAKTLTGFAGAGVVQIISAYRGDTFRAVYTVRYAGAVYVRRRLGALLMKPPKPPTRCWRDSTPATKL